MHFSLVLATVGRTEVLRGLLNSLKNQTHRDFELIVVDQNPDDRLKTILATYQDVFSVVHVKTHRKGASRARDVGVSYANGDIVAFPDDDCEYPADLLGKVEEFFNAHPEIGVYTGRSVDKHGADSGARFATMPGTVARKTELWGRAIEISVFLRKGIMSGVDFDENLGTGSDTPWQSGEITDYLLRLYERGVSIHYNPDLVVFHPQVVPSYKRAYAYGCGMGKVLKVHRMPLWFKAKWLVRPLGGAGLSAASFEFSESRRRWNRFKGRLRGILS